MDFQLHGLYRVQGSHRPALSRLDGYWLEGGQNLLNDELLNRCLQRHPLWRSQFRCTLKPAVVRRREGLFATRSDILYKRSYFSPATGSMAMTTDIVDILKGESLWRQRRAYAVALLGEDGHAAAISQIVDLRSTIANEYYVHEAGHGLGYDVDHKTADGYFRPGGRPSAALIALEEVRADMHALGIALRILPEVAAVGIFVYNVLLRQGIHLEALAAGRPAPYGFIPYLLFREILASGLDLGSDSGSLVWSDRERLLETMESVAQRAEQNISTPEVTARDWIGSATAAAGYVKAALSDRQALAQFEQTMEAALKRLGPAYQVVLGY